jgi:Domain of unknown function (DUF4399)
MQQMSSLETPPKRMKRVLQLTFLVVFVGLLIVPKDGVAQSGPSARSAAPAGAAVYFIDIKNGAKLPSKAVIRFGLRNMGLAPAGVVKAGTGHHHLLVDVGPPPLDRPIPNDPQHLHFGAGQTEAEVALTPGEHVLQLLFADHDHVPHDPPLMSERIQVVVEAEAPAGQVASAPRTEEARSSRKPADPEASVYFVYPSDGAVIHPMSTIRFGLNKMGVAPAGVEKSGTGHHHLLVDVATPQLDRPIPNDPQHLHFGAGQTEVKLTLPPGEHTLQLVIGDEHHVPHEPPVISEKIKVLVRPGGPRGVRQF